MSSESRMRMVRSAATLISTRGMCATSFSDVVADSKAPRGSIYHHFPEGKKQLVEDAIHWTSEQVLAHQRACPADTASGVLSWFIDLWRQSVLRSGGASGCAVAAVALDTGANDNDFIDLIDVARAAFRSWVDLLAGQLQATGVPAGRATSIALAALAGMEGALILCRTEGGTEPLEAIAGELMRLLPAETTATA